MRNNTSKHPNNRNIINAQFDAEHARIFHEMKDLTGMTVSELLKTIVYPALDAYEQESMAAKRKAAVTTLSLSEEQIKM